MPLCQTDQPMSQPDDDKRAIAEALAELDNADMRRIVAEALGVSTSQVSRWVMGKDRMTPRQVFDAERALDLSPGTISARAGYVPVGGCEVEAAIAADDRLDEVGRGAVRAVYRSVRLRR